MEPYCTGLEEITVDAGDIVENLCDEYGDAIGHGDAIDDYEVDEDINSTEEDVDVVNCVENGIIINGMVDILKIDMECLTTDDVERLDFADLQVAYMFYSWFAKVNGFSVRKSHVVGNYHGEKIQQTFLCSRAGFREDRGLTAETRKRETKNETRCGCEVMFRVHVNINTRRWYVTVFIFDHNHDLLEEQFSALLPAHRKMTATDIMQIDNFKKVGIRHPHIYAAFANNAGGYHKVGFVRKDIYNQVGKQRQEQSSDVNGVLNYFRECCSKDPLMFVSYTIDDSNRLQHLFWSDGESQMNYEVFGDVLAFDATYNKNKYMCPFVVFSGVKHHTQTIVFGTALVTNEIEETYVWLLEQFLQSMNRKLPSSVITDGDVVMKNAIRKVFPNVHHKLCAWHLLRNAMSNVRIPAFMPYLNKCMLGDFDVGEFEEKWNEMVVKFGLEDNN